MNLLKLKLVIIIFNYKEKCYKLLSELALISWVNITTSISIPFCHYMCSRSYVHIHIFVKYNFTWIITTTICLYANANDIHYPYHINNTTQLLWRNYITYIPFLCIIIFLAIVYMFQFNVSINSCTYIENYIY